VIGASAARGSLVLSLALVVSPACGPAGRPATGAESLTAQGLSCSDGVELVSACTPTGVELCFNAIDDNCNGVIDEGCGVATGLLQFSIAWNEAAADVDLSVTDPAGSTTSPQNRSTPTGFRLDRDCPKEPEHCNGQNEETVYFEGAEPPRGRYKVDVKLSDPNGASLPLCVRLGARVGSRTFGANVNLTTKDEKKSVTFQL
jgi:tRNA (guanosine-2'-O-)-methyltransferase